MLAKGNPHFVCDARVLVKPYKENGKVPDKFRKQQQQMDRGPVPASLLGLNSLKFVNLTRNMLQGPTPKFDNSVDVDMIGIDTFCLPDPGVPCDSRVNILVAVVECVG
ncbi:hypothetical protein L2E82_40007 [Cichorium intybus]|uniref:Uncharacterized protein n=1 Tax=Cichorium intybus TaxID=13427 RepID=A0ACB9AL63_CICIN|nr:hypothetical protein L2E82_40007 [Cichorium intybus]